MTYTIYYKHNQNDTKRKKDNYKKLKKFQALTNTN